jgi:hypothetical protein
MHQHCLYTVIWLTEGIMLFATAAILSDPECASCSKQVLLKLVHAWGFAEWKAQRMLRKTLDRLSLLDDWLC